MYLVTDYNYDLPPELIAQTAQHQRDTSRLLTLDGVTGKVSHGKFSDVLAFFKPGDVLVLNNTKVIPARLYGQKSTGGMVEVLVADYAGGKLDKVAKTFTVDCLVKASKRIKVGAWIQFPLGLKAEVLGIGDITCTLKFYYQDNFEDTLEQIGQIPLPHYIRRANGHTAIDRTAYQTVFAQHKGAVAAPTAGLHFTPQLLAAISAKGVDVHYLTLHVGYGTFGPVRVDDIRQHTMHSERFCITVDTATAINQAKKDGRRVIAVGTTSVRTLEFAARQNGTVNASTGVCDIFIYPGFNFKVVDAMLTNFHLPKSTLMMLVAAFAGKDNIFAAYKEAVKERYRFFSYGDAMLITAPAA